MFGGVITIILQVYWLNKEQRFKIVKKKDIDKQTDYNNSLFLSVIQK